MLVAIFVAKATCGCFQATNKFYSVSNITIDKRLEGKFGPEATDQSSSIKDSLLISLDKDKHYVATFQEGTNWIKLDAVLFKIGTNIFVDICHLADNGVTRNPAGAPTGLDLLRLATRDNTHSAIRVQFVEDQVEFQFGFGNPVAMAIAREPELKKKVQGEGSVILLDSTSKLQAFLAKIGHEDGIFPQKVRWNRILK